MEDRAEREQHRRSNRGVAWIVLGVGLLVVLLVVGGGVGVVSNLFSAGDLGLSRRVMQAVNGAFGTDSTRFVCDRIHGTLFRGAILERPRLLVRVGSGEFTWAEARRARVEYDLWSLLVSSRRDLTVGLDSLRVALARDSAGAIVMPKFRSGSGKRPSGETRVRFALRDASLALVEEGISLQGLDGKGSVTVGPGGPAILVERLQGEAFGGEAQSPVTISGLAALRDSVWRLDPARVEFAASRLGASAEWDTRRGRLREGTLRLDPLVLHEVLPLFDVEGVDGTLRGEADLAGLPGDGNASGCLSGEIEGEKIDTLLVQARLAREGIVVDRLQTRLRGATVTGRGRIERRGALEATLDFQNANPAAIPWWEAPAGMPQGALAGSARLEITRGKPRPAIRVNGVLGKGRVGRFMVDRATFVVHAPPAGGLFLDSLAVESPGVRVDGSGTFAKDGVLRGNATAVFRDLGQMDGLLRPMEPREGKGRVVASFGGATKTPTVELRGAFTRPRFESGLGADSVTVVASGALAPTLNLRGTLRIADLEAKDRPLGDVTAAFEGGRTMRVPSFELSAGDTTLRMQGTLLFDDAGVTARVDSLRLRAGSLRAVALAPPQVSFAKGRLHASPLLLDLEPGRFDADLDWDLSGGKIDLRGSVAGLELARLGRAANGDSARSLSGRLRAQFLVAGPVADPEVTLRGSVVEPRIRGVRADSLQARLDYAPGVLTVEDLRWDAGATTVNLQGTLRSPRTLETWIRGLRDQDRGWADATTLALEASADSFELASLAPADTSLITLAGKATFRARIGGTYAAPTLALNGRVPGFRYRELSGDIAGFEGSYRDRRLAVDRWELHQGKGLMTARGSIPIDLAPDAKRRILRDEPLRLTVSADGTDFATLTALSPVVAASSGLVSGDAEVTGTPAHPKLTGVVRLRDGRLRFAGRYEVLEGLTVDGTFDEERLNLTKMEARQGKKGRITGTGTWRWSGLGTPLPPGSVGPPGEYSLDVKATDCTVTDREYYLFQFSGGFQVVSSRTESGIVKPRITGSGSVSRGELTLNLAAPVGEPPAPLPFLYDVTADFPRQFKYRQLDTEIDLAGTLRLRNEGERDIALGTLTVKGGQFYFLTRKFGNLSGEVNFNNLEKLDPFVTLDADTHVHRRVAGADVGSDHVVNLAVTGRSSQLQIRPWDTEGSDPSDLWRELSVGQFASAERAVGDNGNDPLAGVGLGSLPIRDYLFRNAERWVAGSGFIDTIDLQGGGSRTGSSDKSVGGPIDLGTVGVGKYVTRDLFLKYSSDFTGQSEKQITAEYRMTRHLLLRGQQVQRSKPTGSQAAQEYNLDLKIRVEY